ATTRAPPVSTRFIASSVPRPPQPSKPTRIAELAAVPRTNSGRISTAPAVAAAPPMNFRRSYLSLRPAACFASSGLRTSRVVRSTADEPFQVCLGCSYIFYLLRPGNFALDGHRAAIVDLLQSLDDARKVDFAFTDGHFLPQVLRICRP